MTRIGFIDRALILLTTTLVTATVAAWPRPAQSSDKLGSAPLRTIGLDAAEPVAEGSLKTTFGRDGLSSLSYHGAELLVKGPARVRYTPQKPDGSPATFLEDKDQHRKVEGDTITREYEGLTIVMTARQKKNVLRLEVTFKNTKDRALTDVGFQPLTVQFPRRPKGGRWKWGYTVTTDNEGEPGVVAADWGDAKLVACCDEVERPVTFGFEGNYGNGAHNALSIGLAKLGAGENAHVPFLTAVRRPRCRHNWDGAGRLRAICQSLPGQAQLARPSANWRAVSLPLRQQVDHQPPRLVQRRETGRHHAAWTPGIP